MTGAQFIVAAIFGMLSGSILAGVVMAFTRRRDPVPTQRPDFVPRRGLLSEIANQRARRGS
jgi:hypothetical protein